jgi:hypothetical protein
MKIARLFFVAFLMLAVPLQGALAVSAGQCMALEHHDAPSGHDAGAHDHGAAAGHDDGEAKGSHCGPCVACCASAAIASSAPVVLQEFSAEHVVGVPQSRVPVSPPGRLFRPPLSL